MTQRKQPDPVENKDVIRERRPILEGEPMKTVTPVGSNQEPLNDKNEIIGAYYTGQYTFWTFGTTPLQSHQVTYEFTDNNWIDIAVIKNGGNCWLNQVSVDAQIMSRPKLWGTSYFMAPAHVIDVAKYGARFVMTFEHADNTNSAYAGIFHITPDTLVDDNNNVVYPKRLAGAPVATDRQA